MHMSQVKIDAKCWWKDVHGGILKRIQRQFFSENDYEQFNLTPNNPDFTIVFGRTDWDTITTPKDRTFYFSQEPLFSKNEPKDEIHNYCSKIFIADKSAYPDREEYIETLMPMFYAGRGEGNTWSYAIKGTNYPKTKIASMIVSNMCNDHFGSKDNCTIIYRKRIDLAKELSKLGSIDISGARWESSPYNIRGHIHDKHSALDDYKFSVACENSIQKNYISEKFWDVIITEAVPLYLGCNNIEQYIPADNFINLPKENIDDMIQVIQDIIDNYESLYEKYKPKVLELKNEFFTNPKFNLWQKIKLEIKNS
tara:strand:- start:2098 stop:3027 length:930 start_codon:yes stop_codon:yes gene_type:complete